METRTRKAFIKQQNVFKNDMIILGALLKAYYNTTSIIKSSKILIVVFYIFRKGIYELNVEIIRLERYKPICCFYQHVYQNLQLQFISDKICYQVTTILACTWILNISTSQKVKHYPGYLFCIKQNIRVNKKKKGEKKKRDI